MTHLVHSATADGAAISERPIDRNIDGTDADQRYLSLAAEVLMARGGFTLADETELTRRVRRHFALRRWRGIVG